ncbi:transcription repressor NadR [uncultured Ruthenibacterium sp.]|uniref:transcription repressor NadR n=1 Tax=uncultured Ruthenibacterium sp. TaxID=1905347 RepID=UPI00349E7BEE
MTSSQRREAIILSLKNSHAPISASKLARELGVSRQIVVGDVALLRAAGTPVLATPRGYMLQTAPTGDRVTVACRHSQDSLLDELYTIVDCGCGILDVVVEHPVYGQLSGQLQIFSRYDADLFWQALKEQDAQPLCTLTGDVHLHTLSCPTPAQRECVLNALQQKGYLYQK